MNELDLIYVSIFIAINMCKKSGGILAESCQSHMESQVGMAGSRHSWWDPTIPTRDKKLIPLGIPPKTQDWAIPPGIPDGIYGSHPGS